MGSDGLARLTRALHPEHGFTMPSTPGAGRYAPSPTGDLHLGNLRTAMIAWAIARRSGSSFVMRMEDLDERVRPQFYDRQLEDLAALGLTWDSLIYQSQREAAYENAFAQLQERGLIYECYCTRKDLAQIASAPHRPPGSYPGTCRNLTPAQREAGRAKLAGMNRGPALRVKTDVAELVVVDEITGPYTGAVDDFVIRRGDGVFSYNFVSVFDDDDELISHITRGNDLLPSTPRQVYLQQLMGLATPKYFHVPMVFNPEGVRLAKRDGAVTMRALADYGWEAGDIAELIGRSLGIDGVRGAGDLAEGLTLEALRGGPWLVDPDALTAGPRACG
ncbi:MAG: tRNA glutamyl-Q(34) synthetase GluQRS [Ancrocorticia sp.]|uniref:tRNA glutamyl-Q(34) synthetase GluQRS n=1 Tax=Ancrocorticia sp. TaxID=2593684 RepID=UPI003F8DC909